MSLIQGLLSASPFLLPQAAELDHLIASQPSSIEAVRLQTFVLPHLQPLELPELLNKHEVTKSMLVLTEHLLQMKL